MEQRLIDANAYAAELWKLRENYQMLDDTHTADKIMHGIFRAEQVLKEQPSVDAVPVVRCRECKWLHIVNDNILYGFCTKGHAMFYPFQLDTREFYCADGERKDDGK